VKRLPVRVVARVRRSTDAYRSRWQAKATPEAIMPLLGMVRQIVIAESDEEARALAGPAHQKWFKTFTPLSRQRALPMPPMLPTTFDEAGRIGFSIAGSASTVRKTLTAQASDAGISYLLCQIAFGTLPLDASAPAATN